jgi:hypothetical protein
MYMGYIQFLLIIFVTIESLGDNPVKEFVFNSPLVAIPVILVIFVLASLLIGYLDSRLGFREEEIRNHSKSNPVLMDIQKSLNELNDKIAQIEQGKINKNSDETDT